jgi:DNA primase small subunit
MTNAHGRSAVTELIRSYYKSQPCPAPHKLEQREFGFGNFDDKVAFRHVAFKSEADLKKHLMDTAPAFVDSSAAYYKFPDARPMVKKEWLGSDLGFDIDATDIPTKCKLVHGTGWVCGECLDAAKAETVKLAADFLTGDFGFSDKEVEINFSGNRGYHVHVRSDSILQLGAEARAEISSYIRGSSLVMKNLFPSLGERGKQLLGPKLSDKGWHGRIAMGYVAALESESALVSAGIEASLAHRLHEKRGLIALGIGNGNWDMVKVPRKDEVVVKVAASAIASGSARIDENVTKDPSHLMRLPNTIHGGTGLVAKCVPSLSALEKFNPMTDAIAFKSGELRVKANSKYAVTMNGQDFGPFDNETVTLPSFVATYLYLKGVAEITSS